MADGADAERAEAAGDARAPARPSKARDARAVALFALREAGARPERFIAQVLEDPRSGYAALDPRGKALARELAYGVTRHRRPLAHILSRVSSVPASRQKPAVRGALLLGAYQLLVLEGIPPHAAVSETVALAGNKRARGFVNAILRRLAALRTAVHPARPEGIPATRLLPLREGRFAELREDLLPDWDQKNAAAIGVAFSYPDAICARWLGASSIGGRRIRAILQAGNDVPPVAVRIHPGRARPEAVAAALEAYGLEVGRVEGKPLALLLPANVAPDRLPGFAEGHFTVQDLTAQDVCDLVGARPGERILDLCAAPGGKAVALADAIGPRGQLVACDLRPARLARVETAAARVGVTDRIERRAGDVLKPESAPEEGAFDRVLVDAPCSNTGVLRRRVEARWRAAALDLARLQRKQLALLEAGARAAKPGGLVVYSTCSIEEDENRGVAMAFLKTHPDARVEAEIVRFPGDGPGDGGYAVALRMPG